MRSLSFVLLIVFGVFSFGCKSKSEQPANDSADVQPGVPLQLATDRAQTIHDLRYDLAFTIPAVAAQPISAHALIRFTLKDASSPLVLDFTPGNEFLTSIAVNRKPSKFHLVKDHIVIPSS